jgi:hypothetical protein
MAVTALAIQATLMIPDAAAQLGTVKIAPASLKSAVRMGDFDIPASAEPFHALMQMSSATSEVPKTKPAKRNATSNLVATVPTTTVSKESKPPVVWTLPQTPAAIESTSVPAAKLALTQGFANNVDNDEAIAFSAQDPGAVVSRYATSETARRGSQAKGPSDTDAVGIPAGGKTADASQRGKAATGARVLPHDRQLPQVSQAAQDKVQAVVAEVPQTLSGAAIEDKPNAGLVEIAKPVAPSTFTETLDGRMPASFVTREIPAAVSDAQTTGVTVETSLRPPAPRQDVVDGMDLAAPQESIQGDSNAPRPASAMKSARKQNDHQREQPEGQTRVTPAAEAVTTISEPTPRSDVAQRIDLPPQNEPMPHAQPAPHREPTTHGEPTPPSVKQVAAPISPAQPAAASGFTPGAVPAPPDKAAAFVPNSGPAALDGEVRTAEVSFEGRLRPMLQSQAETQKIDRAPRTLQQQPSASDQSDQEGSYTSGVTSGAAASADKHSDNQRDRQEGRANISPPAEPAKTSAEPVTHAETEPVPVMNVMPAPVAPHSPAASTTPVQVAAPAPSHAVADGAEAAMPGDQAPAPSAANDIRIALNDNGQRVELRVTERAGDIHVTVRTPDSQLATAMREDLPSLSSRLEQSGFHSEMWRPAASQSGEAKAIGVSSGNAAHDSREQHGGRQQHEDPQQNHRNPQQTLNRKSDRKEFSWLLESIR